MVGGKLVRSRPLGQVEWGRLTQGEFDRIVEALIVRMYEHDAAVEVQALDGRGGDDGIDIDVIRDGHTEVIYQLKCFPEGFSGGFRQTRRTQIKRSFDTAMEQHPYEWVLVVPRKPTNKERSWIRSLAGDSGVRVKIMGPAQLDAALAKHQDLLDAATREPLLEALRDAGQEHVALARPADTDSAVDRLRQRVSGRSLYWDVQVGFDRDRVCCTDR